MRSSRVLVIVVLGLAPGIVLPLVWPLAGLGAGEDDVLYYLPARWFFHDAVQRGEWPWINPFTGLGRPFLADPQSAVFYPFTWMFAWFSPLYAYGAHIWLHHCIAAWGMYRLLRSEFRAVGAVDAAGIGDHLRKHPAPMGEAASAGSVRAPNEGWSIAAGLLGAIAYAYCGFFLAHRVHLTIHAGAAWAPWVFWRMRRFADQPSTSRFVWAVTAAVLQTLSGHAQIAALTALGSLVWLLSQRRCAAVRGCGTTTPGALQVAGETARELSPARNRLPRLVAWLLIWGAAAAICAVQIVPTLEYARVCDRMDRDYFAFTENSWHPLSSALFLSPLLFGNRTENTFTPAYWGPSHQCEQLGYIGILPLLLAGFAVAGAVRGLWPDRGWLGVLIFGLLLGLGRFGPICPLLYLIPGANVFRVPARALLLVDLALCALAAHCFHQLFTAPLSRNLARAIDMIRSITRRPLCLFTGGATAIVFLATIAFAVQRPPNVSLLREALLTLPQLTYLTFLMAGIAVCAWLAAQRARFETTGGMPARRIAIVAIVLTAVDLAWLGLHVDIPRGIRTAASYMESEDRAAIVAEIQREPEAAGPWHRSRLWVVNRRVGDRFGEYEHPWSKLCADSNVMARIPTLNDYGPLQPRAFSQPFAFAPWGYTPIADRLLSDAEEWMAAVNVGWVLLCDDQRSAPAGGEQRLVTKSGYRLFRMLHSAPMGMPSQNGLRVEPASGAPRYNRVWMPRTEPLRPGTERVPVLVGPSIVTDGWKKLAAPETDADRVAFGRGLDVWVYFPPGLERGAWFSAIAITVLAAVCIISTARRAHA